MTQTVKEEERDTVKGNNDKSKNNDFSDDEYDFNFDDVVSTKIHTLCFIKFWVYDFLMMQQTSLKV